jgi:hypothetical protein
MQVFQAEIAARELGFLSLQNALALVVLYTQEDSPKFESAAVGWLLERSNTPVVPCQEHHHGNDL